jgi:hypothetical protein
MLIMLVLVGTLSCQTSTTSYQKSIVVTYSILGSIVKELVGDKATVTVSIPNGLDPHEWEPSARDIETINKADLVIETIEEDLAAKRLVFKEADECCSPHTLLASNTSSLSITEIAETTRNPERVVGMHFFNPVWSMKFG